MSKSTAKRLGEILLEQKLINEEQLEQGLPGVHWEEISRTASTSARFETGLVDQVRLVKSDAELAYIRKAASISDRAVSAGMATAGVGINESLQDMISQTVLNDSHVSAS